MRSRTTSKAAIGAAALALAAAPGARATCLWDCGNGDGIVNVSDFLTILADWGSGGPCDFDGGGVGVTDFLELLAHWGPCPLSGACCDPFDGSCVVVAPDDCTESGGVFAGLFTDCLDSDADRIPNVFELDDCAAADGCYAGTDPFDADTDNDGIEDGDEIYGTLGGLDLPGWGLDPCRKDILIETDWAWHIGQSPDRNKPHPNQVARIVAAFAGAPTPNPNGTTGVNLYLDYGQPPYSGGNAALDPSGDDTVDVGSSFSGGEYFTIKGANFAANRHGYFHYCIMADRYSINGGYVNSSGLAELPGDDFMVTMGQWALGNDNFIGNTIMHELGHNLALRHGGWENRNFKPNYNSVMNYWYQFCGADADFDVIPDDVTDYSHGLNIDLDETSLVEAAGVTGFGPGIDWNLDGDAIDTIGRNINCRLTDTYANSACADFFQQSTTCTSSGECYDLSCNTIVDSTDWLLIQLYHLNDSDFAPPEIIHCILDGAVIVRPGEQPRGDPQ